MSMLAMLRLLWKMLMGIFNLSKSSSFSAAGANGDDDDGGLVSEDLPEDVKEGHFVVHTIDDEEQSRFIIQLGYLAHPGFLKLLDLAEEEFGYGQEGVLAVPCRSNELQCILENQKVESGAAGSNSSESTMSPCS